MTGAERVRTALRHESPDRVPTFFRRSAPAGQALTAEQSRYVDDIIDVGDYLRMSDPVARTERDGRQLMYDELGVGRVYTGLYWDIVDFPLAGVTDRRELLSRSWPEEIDPRRTAGLRERALALRAAGKAVAAFGSWGGSTGVFEQSWYMRGLERFLVDLLTDPDFAETLLDIQLRLHMRRWEMILHEVGDILDIAGVGDDLAGQNAPLISLRLYRDLIKPRHRALIDFIKARTAAKIYYHSCGAVTPFVGDLIEIGVDVLDPVQPASVDPEGLKQAFGRELTFFGGVDVQNTLPFGTPAQVRDEVLRRFDQMGRDGGLILGPSHWLQVDTPWENIYAMYEAIKECRY